jgi:hypothetical protein
MKTATILCALLVLAGCGQSQEQKEKAIRVFSESCAKPLSGILSITPDNTSVKLHCAEFRSMTKASK